MTPDLYLPFALILGFGAFLQATAGFGFALFAIPLLILFGLPPYIAIPALAIASFSQSLSGVIRYRKAVQWKTAIAMAIFAIPFQFMGVKLLSLIVEHFTQSDVRQAFGAVLIVILIVQAVVKPKHHEKLHAAWGGLASGCFGMLNGLTGMGGPPLVLWVMAHKWSSQKSRLMLWSIFVFGLPTNLYFLHHRFDTPELGTPVLQAIGISICFLPAVLAGSLPGIWIGNRIPKPTLRHITTGLLFILALYAIVQPYLFDTGA
ncbi:MAG: sulfite exporter TauE/SafE family protein [Planctomycetota bacterium]|jgi:uncharacterized membrane protein YfcA